MFFCTLASSVASAFLFPFSRASRTQILAPAVRFPVRFSGDSPAQTRDLGRQRLIFIVELSF